MPEIFENLKCSFCSKYLSVFPIRVYPNRQVKCGRCSSDDDKGTVSKLYEIIANNFKFPCVNHYEGCKNFLDNKEVTEHEKTCTGTSIKCPICCNFEGQSLMMLDHFKRVHRHNYLNVSELLIPLSDKNEEKFFLYTNDSQIIMAIVYVKYDNIVRMFYLNIIPICVESANEIRNLRQKFILYSANNELLCSSIEKKCLQYVKYNELNLNSEFNGIFIKEDYRNNVVICKFFIKEAEKIYFNNDLAVQGVCTYFKGSQTITKLKEDNMGLANSPFETEPKTLEKKEVIEEVYRPCSLNHFPVEPVKILQPCQLKHFPGDYVMQLDIENNGTQTMYHYFENIRILKEKIISPIFYIANTSWKICIERHFSRNNPFLSIFLEKEDNEYENKFSYEVQAEIELLSYKNENNLVKSFKNHIFGLRRNETINWSWNDFVKWSILIDPNKQYLLRNEDFIQLKIKFTLVKILQHNLCQCVGCIK